MKWFQSTSIHYNEFNFESFISNVTRPISQSCLEFFISGKSRNNIKSYVITTNHYNTIVKVQLDSISTRREHIENVKHSLWD